MDVVKKSLGVVKRIFLTLFKAGIAVVLLNLQKLTNGHSFRMEENSLTWC